MNDTHGGEFINNKRQTPWLLLVCIAGLGINILLPLLVNYFKLPFYLDNIGSVLTAIVGGGFPGILIGFLTNLIKSLNNPTSLYYGVLTVIMAWVSCIFSAKGFLKKKKGWVILCFIFIFLGGFIGSIMTWYLYGGAFGDDITSKFARILFDRGVGQMSSQIIAGVVMDIPDKLITVVAVYFSIKAIPDSVLNILPLGAKYTGNNRDDFCPEDNLITRYKINNKLTALIVISTVLVGAVAVEACMFFYMGQQKQRYAEVANDAAGLASYEISEYEAKDILENGRNAESYSKVASRMRHIKENVSGLVYIYVMQINENSCTVIFDLDVQESVGDDPGTVIPFDDSYRGFFDDLFAGKDVPILSSKDNYGQLMTAYRRIKMSGFDSPVYVATDISLEKYASELKVFFVRASAVIFCLVILLTSFALWFVQKFVSNPISTILNHAEDFRKSNLKDWLSSDAWINRKRISTDDELEELYNKICEAEEEIVLKAIALENTELIRQKSEQLAEAVEKANEANNAKTDFLSRMSHDIRTPLNGIIGMTYIAQQNDNPPETANCLKKIDTSSKFLLGLINDILDMTKAESNRIEFHLEPYTISEFNEYIDSVIRPLCNEKNQTLNITQNVINETLMVDKLRYNQIFFNILSNAVKYTPECGTIDYVLESTKAEDNKLKVVHRITDSGIGMSEEFQKVLFNPFTQEGRNDSSNNRGTGLGLAIVKKLVDEMGGTIEVSSVEGEGTSFTVTLNLEAVEESVDGDTGKKENNLSGDINISEELLKRKHVLLCEDHPLNQEIMKTILTSKGMLIEIAENGLEGVTKYKNAPENYYDVILMDIRMPVMNGYEATKEIRNALRKDSKSIPIVAMTADAFEDDIIKSQKAGMDSHISKPIDVQKLVETLAKLISRADS